MLAKRIIPCLDVKDGSTVKGINFEGLKVVGDPVEMGAKYSSDGADELVYLDISATREGRATFTDLVKQLSARLNIPFTVGGGISTLDDAARMLEAGADKITVNSAAVLNPAIIDEIAGTFGSQFLVVAIDAKLSTDDSLWHITTHGGSKMTDKTLYDWAHEVQERGAGEIMFTSMNHDGTKDGYPIETFRQLTGTLTIPVIASGGAGNIDHIAEVLTHGGAEAALAASIFHYGQYTVGQVKNELRKKGINIR